ncbi:MAG TPA: acyl-CoA dehydrogenase family protein [Acetobacteraceae bacterium]|nr:acyl-CoA dehydrogenase family protein [Acetobacteraceae bacterium]
MSGDGDDQSMFVDEADSLSGLGPLLNTGLDPEPGYAAIARAEAMLVARTGLLGLGAAFAVRQMVARFFILGFGTEAQRAAWRRATAAVAISEPGVGAHPKHLATRAEPVGEGWRITGEKAWVSNGPLAAVFIVLAIMAEEAGRKRYGAFLVPLGTPGLSVKETEAFRAMPPSRHCGLILDGCAVPRAALLGPPGEAYEAMALPFRDVEDAVGLSGLAGACRFLVGRLGSPSGSEAALSLGGLAALTAVLEAGAARIAAALDTGHLAEHAAEAIGLRLLAAEIAARAQRHCAEFASGDDPAVTRVLADMEASQSVARGARAARLERLGRTALTTGPPPL